LIIAGLTKSAQWLFSGWLTDAMAAPTPVSALLHAATMVTAGNFLVLRVCTLWTYSLCLNYLIPSAGAFTALSAGITGSIQSDKKKIIAYSTTGQLGNMLFSCGLSNYSGAMFHLFSHGFFKALLFLAAGGGIHSLGYEQDIYKIGGINKSLPLGYIFILIGSLSLIGIPFYTGNYSKDLIIHASDYSYVWSDLFLNWISNIPILLTTLYSTKLLYLVFIKEARANKSTILKVGEGSKLTLFPLIIALGIPSIGLGYLGTMICSSSF